MNSMFDLIMFDLDGTLATKKAGPGLALPNGYNMGQPIQECAPDRVIADCSALLN
ncbi:MAG: hypothetical protein IPO19_22740 [Rhodoferax sp.]|nr:hypothetical protein [Rhodoferax sp.]